MGLLCEVYTQNTCVCEISKCVSKMVVERISVRAFTCVGPGCEIVKWVDGSRMYQRECIHVCL